MTQRMTPGERMVWAEVFAARLIYWYPNRGEIAAREASMAIYAMRSLDRGKLDEDQNAMLSEMLSEGSYG